MANKPFLDLLPRNLEFHNLSHLTLTTTQSRTLGLGLKFRPTRQPPAARVFDNHIQDFCRSVRSHYKYADKPEDPDFNPKLYVKSNWNPPREDPVLEEACIRFVGSYLQTSAIIDHNGKITYPVKNYVVFETLRTTRQSVYSLLTRTLVLPSFPRNGWKKRL